MHFNDLLIRLRTQALAGVAAISALVGIFTRTESGTVSISWEVAALIFLALLMFWIAIWILDFAYYNKLLLGAVTAIMDLEKESKNSDRVYAIELSTVVEAVVAGSRKDSRSCSEKFRTMWGRWAFYSIVFIALVLGLIWSVRMYLATE